MKRMFVNASLLGCVGFLRTGVPGVLGLLMLLVSFQELGAFSSPKRTFQVPDAPPGIEAQTPPASVPLQLASAAPSLPEDRVDRFFFVEETVDQVLIFLSELTGRKVLSPSSLPNVTITFDSQGGMLRRDAIVAVESLLQLNGIAVAELGDTFIRVLPANAIRFKSPDILEGNSLHLPPSERVFAKIFQFKFLKFEEASTVLGNLLTQGIGYLEPIKSTNAVLVTDSLVNLQRMERLLATLDVPSRNEMIVHKLQYLKSSELQKKLRESVDGPLKPFLEGTVSIDADERTNHVIVVTAPANKPFLNHLIATLDQDVTPMTFNEIAYLKHAEAEKVVAIMESLISGQKKGSETQAGGSSRPVPLPADTGEDEGALLAESAGKENDSDLLRFSPYVTLVADERSNAVLVYGTRNDLKFAKEVIAGLDVLLPQVRIDVVITEVTLTNDNSRGIERFGVSYDENEEITFKFNEGSSLPFTMEGTLSDFILRSMTVRNFTLATVFDTASKDANVRVISAPTLVTTHNREATINAGESRPVITSSNTDSTGLSTRSQVQFKDIGVQLKVKPLIGSNNMVQMEIQQTVENVVDEVLIDGNSQPVIGKREATSYVSVSSGEVVVLGGLQERVSRETEGKLGFFGSIPVVGRLLFSSNRKNQTTRELIIFIKPTVYLDAVSAQQDANVAWQALTPEMQRDLQTVMRGMAPEGAQVSPDETPVAAPAEQLRRTPSTRKFNK